MKMDSTGQFVWSQTTGNRTPSQNFPSKIVSYQGGVILLSGFTDTITLGINTIHSLGGSLDNLMTCYNSNGTLLWYKNFGGYSQDIPRDVCTNNNSIYFAGRNMSGYAIDTISITTKGFADILITKFLDQSITSIPEANELMPDINLLIFPNPSEKTLTIECEINIDNIIIEDVFGNKIYTKPKAGKSLSLSIEKAGIYFLTATVNDESITKKIVITK